MRICYECRKPVDRDGVKFDRGEHLLELSATVWLIRISASLTARKESNLTSQRTIELVSDQINAAKKVIHLMSKISIWPLSILFHARLSTLY